MEQVIIVALESYSGSFVGPKIELAARFGHLIVRHLGICQLAQALSGIFANPQSLKDMAEAWDGIDFEAVRNQAALVTNCQHDVLGHCFDDFRQVISNPNVTIENFIRFVECTYERCLQPSLDGERSLSPRSLLVRWCFVSSQLIRDLTLRSATSFGSFQIVNLFFDEWLGFKVLRKVALHVAAVAASVDATSSEAVLNPSTSHQPNPMIYVAPASASYQNFSIDGHMDQQRLSQEGTTPTPGSVPSAHNSEGAPRTGADGFLFSPTTSQAFAIAQQQASGGSAGPSPNAPSYSGDDTFVVNQPQEARGHGSVGTSSNPSGSQSDYAGPQYSGSVSNNGHSPNSQQHPNISPTALLPTLTSDNNDYGDLMDVRNFVMNSTQDDEPKPHQIVDNRASSHPPTDS